MLPTLFYAQRGVKLPLDLEKRFPDIPWREPLPIKVIGGKQKFACRLCIGQFGIKGTDIGALPTTHEAVLEHLEEIHPR